MGKGKNKGTDSNSQKGSSGSKEPKYNTSSPRDGAKNGSSKESKGKNSKWGNWSPPVVSESVMCYEDRARGLWTVQNQIIVESGGIVSTLDLIDIEHDQGQDIYVKVC